MGKMGGIREENRCGFFFFFWLEIFWLPSLHPCPSSGKIILVEYVKSWAR